MKSGLGYGLQVYSGFAEAATHTWDSSVHPKDPGPAPDPTLLNDDETNKTVVILKNYVTLDTTDPANPVEKVDGNYTRTLNPHQIAIEDEPGPGYKVIAWETSITTPPTIPDGNKTPWREVISNSTQTQQGINPTIVKLDEEEIVLYVKLQRIAYQIS